MPQRKKKTMEESFDPVCVHKSKAKLVYRIVIRRNNAFCDEICAYN